MGMSGECFHKLMLTFECETGAMSGFTGATGGRRLIVLSYLDTPGAAVIVYKIRSWCSSCYSESLNMLVLNYPCVGRCTD